MLFQESCEDNNELHTITAGPYVEGVYHFDFAMRMSGTNSIKHSDSRRNENSTVTLWIDSYTDIFSDFDPRPFSGRMISDDFISQVRRASREMTGKVTVLRLLVPDGTQKDEHEKVIRKRLQSFFLTMYQQILDELRSIRSRGWYFIIAGVVLMLVASYISYVKLSGFHINILLVLFEPGSWFLFWTGLDSFTSLSRSKKRDLDFYSKLSGMHIEFDCYK